jgi:hypothetical protein
MIDLNNVDNTSDLNKPISNAVKNALNQKASITSPTFIGNVLINDTSGEALIVKGSVNIGLNLNVGLDLNVESDLNVGSDLNVENQLIVTGESLLNNVTPL